jgi:PncC family amidohydrolase
MLIEEKIGAMLSGSGLTLAVAESCTGGLLGHRITSASGSSAYFIGGVVAYSNDVKRELLGVGRGVIAEHGAVSEAVAREMAEQARKLMRADIGVGITGIAGPDGGTRDKPVGLVYVGLAAADGTVVREFNFAGDRTAVKTAGSQAALEMIETYLKEKGAQNG